MSVEKHSCKNNFLKCVINLMFKETDEEIWKEIKGFENQYAISTKGRVKNLKTNRILGDRYDSNGYKIVDLKRKNYKIHRLVALVFLPNPNKLLQVNHIDERKDNNDISNLEWVTASENVKHSIHHKSCRINQLTLDGELVKTWDSFHQIKRELGYNISVISDVCRDKYKQAYGFRWEYSDTSQLRKYNRPVAVLTKEGEFVAKYKSAAYASRCLKISYTQVHRCLNGKAKSTHGLKFIYVD